MVASGETSQPRLFVDLRAKASTEHKQQEQRTDSSLDAPAAGDAAATPPPETSANVDTDTQAIAPATQVARGAPEQGKQADSQTQAAEDTDGSTDSRTAAPGGPAAAEPLDPTLAAFAEMDVLLDDLTALIEAAQAADHAGTWSEGDSRDFKVTSTDQALRLSRLANEVSKQHRAPGA